MRHNEWLFNVNTHPHGICVHHYSSEDQLSLTAVSFDFLFFSLVICNFKRSIRALLKSLATVKLGEQNWIKTRKYTQFWVIREMWGSEWEHSVTRRLVSLRYLQWSKFVLLLQGNRKHQSWIRTSGKLWFFPPSVFPESLISASKMNVQQLPLNTLSWQRGLSLTPTRLPGFS